MTTPNPRSKLLPARGNYADLLAQVDDILDGEMCYAYDQDQYYQKEGAVLVPVGIPDAPADGEEYVRKDNAWEVATGGGGGGGEGTVQSGTENTIAYYQTAGNTVSPTSTRMTWNESSDTLFAENIECDTLTTTGTGSSQITAGNDLLFLVGGDIDCQGTVIRNLGTPTDPAHAATKQYVDDKNVPDADIVFDVRSFNDNEYAFQPGRGFPAEETNPSLVLYRGFQYRFYVPQFTIRPLLIKTTTGADATNLFSEGVTGQGTENVIFTVPMNPSQTTLYYQCELFGPMNGTITIL